MSTSLVVIDSRVANCNAVIASLAADTGYVVLDRERDGVVQIMEALAGKSGYSSIQIISHGMPGSITLGSTMLDSAALHGYSAMLATIGSALLPTGDLMLYGCNIGAVDVGQHFVTTLAALTGADVAASDDLTGSAVFGGDWELEVKSGVIESNIQTFNLNGTLDSENTILGSIFEDYIDADAWGFANNAASNNDAIYGDRSNDTIDGGAGDDTAKYDDPYTNYTITRNSDWTITVKDNRTGSPLGTDTLIDVEHLYFSWYSYGNLNSQTLNLVIQGTPASNSTQANTISGSIFEDYIDADAWGIANAAASNNDSIYGDRSNDTIDGGAGDDTAKYDAQSSITDGTDKRTIDVTDSTQVTFSGKTVTINPTDDLQAGHHYNVEMASGVIKDKTGNAFAGISDATTLDFTTIDNSTTLFYDDFSNPLNSTQWDYNHWQAENNPSYYGRTQQRQSLPEVSDGYLHLKLDTYNPTGYSFFGSEVMSNPTFSNENGAIVFEIKAHLVDPIVGGIVGGMFFYSPNSGSTHDEIDVEAVSNRLNEIQTNIYANEPLGAGHPQFNTITGTLTDDHVYRAEWYKDAVLWFVDGELVREEITNIPTEPMALHLNIWVPGQEWAEGYNPNLDPVITPGDNSSYDFDVDFVQVTQLSSKYYDDDAPVLISSTPSCNTSNVAIDSNITLTFSEDIQAGTGNFIVTDGTDIRTIDVTDTSQVTFDGDTVTINPVDDLHSGSNYHVEMTSGVIQDTTGNAFAGINDAETLDFETISALSGHITFWKTGEAITDVTTTLTTLPTDGTHAIELKNIHVKADGSYTVEVWATTPNSTTGSFECEFVLPTNSSATWQDSAKLPARWTSTSNTIASGNFLVDGMSTNPLVEGQVKLGTLTITMPTEADNFELLLIGGQLGDNDLEGFGINSISSNTGSGNEYIYHSLPDGNYLLTADKLAGAREASAIHANDALAALKMAVEINPNSDGSGVLPYQFLAADINQDGKVRANDALNILKMAVGIDTAPDNNWLFVSQDETLAATISRTAVDWSVADINVLLNADTQLHLIGIVQGDVDGSWVT